MARTPEPPASEGLVACWHCRAILRPDPARRCPRCEARLEPLLARLRHNGWAALLAFGSLVYAFLALGLPMLKVTRLGHSHETSLWGGTVALLQHGQLVVGLIVLVCSVILPLFKAASMAWLATGPTRRLLSRHQRATLLQVVEVTGRFGLIDVFLVAILVALLKLGDLVEVGVGPGLLAFSLCIVFSLLSTLFFDPRTIWED